MGTLRSAAIITAVPLLAMGACTAVLGAGGAGQGSTAAADSCQQAGPQIVAASAPPAPSAPTSDMAAPGSIPAQIGVWKGEQLVNAGHVIKAGQALGLDAWSVTVGVMTTMGESNLRVLDHGDAAGPDSRGLWQQRDNGAGGDTAADVDVDPHRVEQVEPEPIDHEHA